MATPFKSDVEYHFEHCRRIRRNGKSALDRTHKRGNGKSTEGRQEDRVSEGKQKKKRMLNGSEALIRRLLARGTPKYKIAKRLKCCWVTLERKLKEMGEWKESGKGRKKKLGVRS